LSEGRSAAGEDSHRRVRYVDLILGAWRPREAAFQLAAELGIELRSLHADDPERALMTIGSRAIDVAAEGDPTIMTAHDDAARVGSALPVGGTVAVFAPFQGLSLRVENEWFFLFLRRRGISIAVIGEDPVTTIGKSLFERRRGITAPVRTMRPETLQPEQRRLLRVFPGLLPRALAERLRINPESAGLIPYGPAHFLIPASYRDREPRAASREFDAMAAIERLDDGLYALCQSFCTSYFADPAALADLSRRMFQGGSADLGLSLAERARAVARKPEDTALADLRRQEVRLFERRFGEILEAPEASPQAPPALRGRLGRLKIMGAVMGRELRRVEEETMPLAARLKAGERLDADDLYLLALLAEARLANGDTAGAFLVANALEAWLARSLAPDQRIAYASAVCLHRVDRLRGDPDASRAALERAFATSLGARGLHEIIELNVLRALSEADAGSPDARFAWLRAALAWLALDPSEGLSRTAMLAVLGKEVVRAQLDIDVSETLGNALDAAWPSLPFLHRAKFPSIRGVAPREDGAMMLAGPGVGILWSEESGNAPVHARPRLRLIRLAFAALAEICPRFAEIESGTVIVDTNEGIDLPRTREEALTIALRRGAAELVFGHDDLTFDDTIRARFAADLRVALSPIVAKVEEAGGVLTAKFRRHLFDRPFTDSEARIIAPLRDGVHFPLSAMAELLGQTPGEAEPALRRLEADRVLRLDAVAGR
jgi:hypothetical protein